MERTPPPISMSIASNRGTYIDALENLHCNKKSNICSAEEALDAFTLFERAAVTHVHDTANAQPARAVPQQPKRSK